MRTSIIKQVTITIIFTLLNVPVSFAKEIIPDATDIKVNNMISSNMVLQQKAKCHIWGTASPKGIITIEFEKQKKTIKVGKKGEWDVVLKKMRPGGPYTLKVIGAQTIEYTNIMVGDVWLCAGQSNMAQTLRDLGASAKESIPNLRLLKVKHATSIYQEETIKGTWNVCNPSTAESFSAVGYYFGKALSKDLDGYPIGLILSAWGSTGIQSWTSYKAMKKNKELKHYSKEFKSKKRGFDSIELEKQPFVPTVLYNAMIYPLRKLPIKGVIWYQGEANVDGDCSYQTQLITLIKDWRKTWKNRSMPFLIAQLSSFKKDGDETWAEMRQEQYNVTKSLPKTGFIVTVDVGNGTYHPDKKEIIGERFAIVAGNMVYKKKSISSGPTYDSMTVSGTHIKVKFKHIGSGLIAKDGELKQFFIAGKNKKFVEAKAVIDGPFVVVSADDVKKPKYVRYAWSNNPEGCNLYNKEGLPAIPFKTDKGKGKKRRRR